MQLKIATWNINSLRLRQDQVCKVLKQEAPHIICLQEIKSPVEFVPKDPFESIGYKHIVARGEKGYNGVAVISRLELKNVWSHNFCSRGDARHVAVVLNDGITIENFYVPAGGDTPDAALNEKFAHKLDFLDEMSAYFSKKAPQKTVLVGDLNVAPGENDVWSHKQLRNVVSHTELEVKKLMSLKASAGFVDITRKHIESGKLFSWWSYRSPNWENSDRGRRLDHVWASEDIASGSISSFILKEVRGWVRPSDHVPVFAEFNL